MRRLLFGMILAGAIIISTLSSCSKSDSFTDPNTSGNTSHSPVTLNLTANHWEEKADRVFVNIFKNVIPAENANYPIKVYVVVNGKDMQIDQPISFMNGALWATCSQTNVAITYRGDLPEVQYLNIKVVID
jgi:ABC-type glycerol-3-phosphate transport system substrate-binding protein